MKEKLETDSLFENEYEMVGFSYMEIVMLRQLVTDRIENRFAYAVRAAQSMDSKALASVTDEINRLEILKGKLMEEVWND